MNGLEEFRVKAGLSYDGLARLLGISKPSAYRYARGMRIPPVVVMARIVDATSGAVRPEHFYSSIIETRDASSPVPVAVAGSADPAYCPPIGADAS